MKENYYSSISLFPSIEKGFLSQRRKKTLHICYLMRLVNISNVSINIRGNFLAVSRYRASSVTPSITTIIERPLGRASSALNDLIKESRLRDSNGRTKGRPTSHPRTTLEDSLARGKGLSWPANGTDLCGLGRRLSVCKKISLASARAP